MAVEYQDMSRASGRAGPGATGASSSRAEARGRVAAMLALAGLAGCGHPDEPTTDDPVPFVVPGWDGGTVDPIAIDGAWVFRMSGAWGEQALLMDEVHIDDGCLLVGESAVIWPAAQVSFAAALVADVRSGATPIVRLVGGQSSDVPAVVTDRCAVEGVWRASSYE